MGLKMKTQALGLGLEFERPQGIFENAASLFRRLLDVQWNSDDYFIEISW